MSTVSNEGGRSQSNSGGDSDNVSDPFVVLQETSQCDVTSAPVRPLILRNEKNTPPGAIGAKKMQATSPVAVFNDVRVFRGGFLLRAEQSCCCLFHPALTVDSPDSTESRHPPVAVLTHS